MQFKMSKNLDHRLMLLLLLHLLTEGLCQVGGGLTWLNTSDLRAKKKEQQKR